MMLLPFERGMFSFIVTLNAFDVRPTCDTADVQVIHSCQTLSGNVLCDVPNCCVDALSAILVVSLEVVGGGA